MDWRAWLEERDIPFADEGDRLVLADLAEMRDEQVHRVRDLYKLPINTIRSSVTSEWRGDRCHYVIRVDGSAGLAQLVRAPAL